MTMTWWIILNELMKRSTLDCSASLGWRHASESPASRYQLSPYGGEGPPPLGLARLIFCIVSSFLFLSFHVTIWMLPEYGFYFAQNMHEYTVRIFGSVCTIPLVNNGALCELVIGQDRPHHRSYMEGPSRCLSSLCVISHYVWVWNVLQVSTFQNKQMSISLYSLTPQLIIDNKF